MGNQVSSASLLMHNFSFGIYSSACLQGQCRHGSPDRVQMWGSECDVEAAREDLLWMLVSEYLSKYSVKLFYMFLNQS